MPEVPLKEALARPVEEWDGVLVNDFEETVFAKYPELAAIKRSLYDCGAVYASMSGSGSALFALYRK
jgi:4-diphosphocytidyl-2-C-methyl-D-erythritol kinase